LPRRPAGVFVNGDCAYNQGEPGDYQQFTGLLEPLRVGGLPLHLALGNHDQREHFWAALPPKDPARRPVANKQVALVKSSNVNWFILDSLETAGAPAPSAQRSWHRLAKSLDANARPAVLILHHNPACGKT
jgi:hypothetical protein